ncbi:MAG: hypothetical protein SGPRY_007261 [Prymnesium sp.]
MAAPRFCAPLACAREPPPPDQSSGLGFGKPKYDEEVARGKEALEKLRLASKEAGYDSSLQGLQSDEEAPVEVPQEFKSQITLGFAGFLIVGGVVSLLVGGSIWEAKESKPIEDGPAFGFVPQATSRPEAASTPAME